MTHVRERADAPDAGYGASRPATALVAFYENGLPILRGRQPHTPLLTPGSSGGGGGKGGGGGNILPGFAARPRPASDGLAGLGAALRSNIASFPSSNRPRLLVQLDMFVMEETAARGPCARRCDIMREALRKFADAFESYSLLAIPSCQIAPVAASARNRRGWAKPPAAR
ncbi:hypothetical protein T492DRAFT_832110 [Pavlovales sp. CCMP2436]|nr:hypothetical protein T492DRAFT_832110 [Pavlovales sp. CCMP2436]